MFLPTSQPMIFFRPAIMDEYPNQMNRYRTAALALAGWSLMLPPTSHTLRLEMTKDLSKWNVHSTHVTEAECEQEKQRLLRQALPMPRPTRRNRRCAARAAICLPLGIATRDVFRPTIRRPEDQVAQGSQHRRF